MALILIVEDNEMNADMLSRRVVRLGHEVVVGENGQIGLDLTVKLRPDLILMDMSLPVMDGWEATRRIKADCRIAQIPVLALTAHAIVGDRNKALHAGCDEYETKPINWQRLRDKIAVLLSRHVPDGGNSGGSDLNRSDLSSSDLSSSDLSSRDSGKQVGAEGES